METYQIDPDGSGFFKVTVTTPNGGRWVRDGFVSEWAAQKWVKKCQKNEGEPARSRSPAKAGLLATKHPPPTP
jgi:hypothetical protein